MNSNNSIGSTAEMATNMLEQKQLLIISHFFLFIQKNDQSFSKNHFDALPKLIAPNYTLRHSQPVEFQRSLLSLSFTEASVKAIHESEIEPIPPEFIMNSDEIGLGGSTSKRMKKNNRHCFQQS